MVTQLPLDPMHLVLIGVTKRLLKEWFLSGLKKLLPNNIENFDALFLKLKPFFCREFSRQKLTTELHHFHVSVG